MQAGLFNLVIGSAAHSVCLFEKLGFHPIGISIPLDVSLPMGQMHRPGLSIESQSPPVPELEGEDVRSGAYFQNHRILA